MSDSAWAKPCGARAWRRPLVVTRAARPSRATARAPACGPTDPCPRPWRVHRIRRIHIPGGIASRGSPRARETARRRTAAATRRASPRVRSPQARTCTRPAQRCTPSARARSCASTSRPALRSRRPSWPARSWTVAPTTTVQQGRTPGAAGHSDVRGPDRNDVDGGFAGAVGHPPVHDLRCPVGARIEYDGQTTVDAAVRDLAHRRVETAECFGRSHSSS